MATITFTEASERKCFEGVVKAGKLNGMGKLTLRNGTEVEGSWLDNQLQTSEDRADNKSSAPSSST